jgi:hypothetical protein
VGGDGQVGPSKKRKKKEDDDGEVFEIVEGLSGDEVDHSNIIAGGRGSRRGRARTEAAPPPKYSFAAKKENSDDDSW